jgi:hypothetical protein
MKRQASVLRQKGALLVEVLHQGSIINAGVYCDTLKKLRHAIQNKQCSMLSKGVVMLHDNARSYTAAAMQDLIVTFGWEKFHDDNEVKEAVNTWFPSQAASFYYAEK